MDGLLSDSSFLDNSNSIYGDSGLVTPPDLSFSADPSFISSIVNAPTSIPTLQNGSSMGSSGFNINDTIDSLINAGSSAYAVSQATPYPTYLAGQTQTSTPSTSLAGSSSLLTLLVIALLGFFAYRAIAK